MLDLFIMDADGSNQTHIIRGGSASWSPDGKSIVSHRSASDTGIPTTPAAGRATIDLLEAVSASSTRSAVPNSESADFTAEVGSAPT